MKAAFIRVVANVAASAVLFWIGLVVAWAVDQPDWAVVNAIVSGPFIALASAPFFLVIHSIAALAGFVAGRAGIPERGVAIIAAGLLGCLPFVSGPDDSSTFGNPTIAGLGFFIAAILPWLLGRLQLRPSRQAI